MGDRSLPGPSGESLCSIQKSSATIAFRLCNYTGSNGDSDKCSIVLSSVACPLKGPY